MRLPKRTKKRKYLLLSPLCRQEKYGIRRMTDIEVHLSANMDKGGDL